MNAKYGLMYPEDDAFLDLCASYLEARFPSEPLNLIEIGVHEGRTAGGLIGWLSRNGQRVLYHGVDIKAPPNPVVGMTFHLISDSLDGAGCFAAATSHMVIIDACHCFTHVVSDFLAYKDCLKPGGLLLFHDATQHWRRSNEIPGQYQGHGDVNNPLRYIAVRPALEAVGLIGTPFRWADQFEFWGENSSDRPLGQFIAFSRV